MDNNGALWHRGISGFDTHTISADLLFKIFTICCNNRVKFDLLSAGFHLEGPFISLEKKGAHPEQFLRTFKSGGIEDLIEAYGSLDNVAMVTLAPELAGSLSVVRELCQRGITVSLGERHLLTHIQNEPLLSLKLVLHLKCKKNIMQVLLGVFLCEHLLLLLMGSSCMLLFSSCRSLCGQPVPG